MRKNEKEVTLPSAADTWNVTTLFQFEPTFQIQRSVNPTPPQLRSQHLLFSPPNPITRGDRIRKGSKGVEKRVKYVGRQLKRYVWDDERTNGPSFPLRPVCPRCRSNKSIKDPLPRRFTPNLLPFLRRYNKPPTPSSFASHPLLVSSFPSANYACAAQPLLRPISTPDPRFSLCALG